MLAKPIAILASAAIVTEVVAAHARRHAHQHVHDKRGAHFVEDVAHLDVVVETVTDWVVVTVTEGDEPTSSARDSPIIFVENTHTYPHTSSTSSTSTSTSTSTSSTTSTTPPPAPPPTTLTTSVAPTKAAAVALSASVAVDTPAAAAAAPAATTPASSGSKKRGLAYNDASLLPPFVGDGSKVDWAYNWGQTSSGMTIDVEYVPMLWSNGANFAPTWNANAAAAIAAGSGHLLSFNEPDNPGQADMSPAEAASAHIQYMNPFAGKAAIGAPAITNSGSEGQGLSWLTQFLGACAGQCHIDFYPIHWYSPCDSGAFLSYLLEVYQTVKADVWITEFAPTTGDDSDISQFLQEVMSQMDGNSTFSFVQRYSYFMVEDGSLISSGTTLSSIGSTFAYS